MFLKLGALILLQTALNAITITVSSDQERCMIVSSNDHEQFLKVDLKFESFSGQSSQEGYRIVLHNTENHQEQAFQVFEGVFRRELKLTQNVVYRLCFKIVLVQFRSLSKPVEYNTGIKHKFSLSESRVSVPERLLKSKDLSESYTFLSRTNEMMKRVEAENEGIKKEETQAFEVQTTKMQTFKWITIVEIIIICLFGGYQYFKLRQIIDQKQKY